MRTSMSPFVSSLVVAGCALVAAVPAAQATAVYTYSGTPFTVHEPAFAPAPLGSQITATLTFASPLPANAVGYCLGSGCLTAQPTFWDVNIGIAQRLRSDNADFPATFSPFLNPVSFLSTDALGNIVQWSIEFDERNFSAFTVQFGVLSSIISGVIESISVFDKGGVGEAEWGSVAIGRWSTGALAVPLPSTNMLLLLGFAGLMGSRWYSKAPRSP